MKIKLVSDLHLEFSNIDIPNDQNYDVLILGGDIMVAQDLHDHPAHTDIEDHAAIADVTRLSYRQIAAQQYRDFLKKCSLQFPHVIFVMGNHEFYHGKFFDSIQHMREECARYHNIYLLEQDTKIIDDVVFIGATLWTNMNRKDPLTMRGIEDVMNDFKAIRNDRRSYARLRSRDVVSRHADTLTYFQSVLDQYKDKKCVVVGHHSPSLQSIHAMYADQRVTNGGYHSDLDQFILDHPQIVLWTHGHTHHPFDYMIGKTRVVCNPRGYESDDYNENTGWNPNILLEI
jgi:hypothetical protein